MPDTFSGIYECLYNDADGSSDNEWYHTLIMIHWLAMMIAKGYAVLFLYPKSNVVNFSCIIIHIYPVHKYTDFVHIFHNFKKIQ